MASTPLPTVVNMKVGGGMGAMMGSERVPGMMDGATVGSGGMGWPTAEVLKLIPTAMFDMKGIGSTMSLFDKVFGRSTTKKIKEQPEEESSGLSRLLLTVQGVNGNKIVG